MGIFLTREVTTNSNNGNRLLSVWHVRVGGFISKRDRDIAEAYFSLPTYLPSYELVHLYKVLHTPFPLRTRRRASKISDISR